jgi:hypothetical protein
LQRKSKRTKPPGAKSRDGRWPLTSIGHNILPAGVLNVRDLQFGPRHLKAGR